MGGFGSGRKCGGGPTTASLPSVGVEFLEATFDEAGNSMCVWRFGGRITGAVSFSLGTRYLNIKPIPELTALNKPLINIPVTQIELRYEPCRFGGERAWLVCSGCTINRRNLYFYQSAFRCRVCHKLPYQSQRQRPVDRIYAKARAIRERLGAANPSVLGCRISKPKYMHWKTYYALLAKDQALHASAWVDTSPSLKRLLRGH